MEVENTYKSLKKVVSGNLVLDSHMKKSFNHLYWQSRSEDPTYYDRFSNKNLSTKFEIPPKTESGDP